jgi:hypothetical protein
MMRLVPKKETKVENRGYVPMEDWTDDDWADYISQWYSSDDEVLKEVQQAIAPLLVEEE